MDIERSKNYPLRRRKVVKALLKQRGDLLIVAGLGAPAWDVTAAGDGPLNFPLWGAMGGAVPVGLGLALAQPARRVLVITGDGEMLMGLGSLATVAIQRPTNLAIIVLDNERYGETGMQMTHTAGSVNLAEIAVACGIPICSTLSDEEGFQSALPQIRNSVGPVFFNIKVRAEKLPLVLPPKDGAYLKDRFRLALLGPRAIT
ncbi:MAG: thiamine pyrophosphate-dependent enzyme [Desulfatiglandaceae bacterium]|jgi:thiamine pyrophosphate-dependent acetolactate synthase large subunit-like protein